MEKDRSAKIIAIVALFVGVMGLTIGFSTFTQTLNIQTAANVTVDKATDWKVGFSNTNDSIPAAEVTVAPDATESTATGEDAKLTGTTISNLKAKFTAPGQKVVYKFNVVNDGNIDAYLNTVTFKDVGDEAGVIKSVKAVGSGTEAATQAYMDAALAATSVTVNVGGTDYKQTTAVSNSALADQDSVSVTVTIEYKEHADQTRLDGDVEFTFGDVTLGYSTVDTNRAS